MSRLTTRVSIMGRKHDIERGQAHHWKNKLKDYDYPLIEEVIDKLGELEDIEGELGIDLITLFKALDLKQPIFVKDFQGVCEFNDTIVSSRFITNGNQLTLVDDFSRESMYLNLNEYGKTWALTREELD